MCGDDGHWIQEATTAQECAEKCNVQHGHGVGYSSFYGDKQECHCSHECTLFSAPGNVVHWYASEHHAKSSIPPMDEFERMCTGCGAMMIETVFACGMAESSDQLPSCNEGSCVAMRHHMYQNCHNSSEMVMDTNQTYAQFIMFLETLCEPCFQAFMTAQEMCPEMDFCSPGPCQTAVTDARMTCDMKDVMIPPESEGAQEVSVSFVLSSRFDRNQCSGPAPGPAPGGQHGHCQHAVQIPHDMAMMMGARSCSHM